MHSDSPPRPPEGNYFEIGGIFQYRILDVDGSELVPWTPFHNGVNNTALNDLLTVYLNSGTQKTTWYIGLIDNSGFSSLSASDTIASHAGWSENTAYSETVRQTCVFGAASGQVINNVASVAAFTINATVAINGGFLVSNNVKGGTTGLLFATGSFAGVQNLSSGQVLQVRYDCSAASS